jgi:hypothetical protein
MRAFHEIATKKKVELIDDFLQGCVPEGRGAALRRMWNGKVVRDGTARAVRKREHFFSMQLPNSSQFALRGFCFKTQK